MVSNSEWMEEYFPSLKNCDYRIVSEANVEYNCVAWATGDSSRWWSYLQGYYWLDANRTEEIASLIEVFVKLGYEACEGTAVEDGYDKIALYSKGQTWTHAARQLPNGRWASKLGVSEDIEHPTLDSLVGDYYGSIYCVMRKKRI